jgi:hypothetical protein
MSLFWKTMSAVSDATTGFKTRCPKCGGKMRREEMHDQTYTRAARGRFASTARPTAMFNTEIGRKAVLQVQVVPVYDVCTACGFRVRRRDMKMG